MTDASQAAVLLVAHGSRSAAWRQTCVDLLNDVREQMPSAPVALAFLGAAQPDIPTAIAELVSQGLTAVTVMPLFLAPGGHVMEDIPAAIDTAAARHPGVTFRTLAPLAQLPAVRRAIVGAAMKAVGPGAS